MIRLRVVQLKVNISLERFLQIILHLLDQPAFRSGVESPAQAHCEWRAKLSLSAKPVAGWDGSRCGEWRGWYVKASRSKSKPNGKSPLTPLSKGGNEKHPFLKGGSVLGKAKD